MDEMVPMEEDEAVPMVKSSFGCELGSHCPAASECTTSFEVGSAPDRPTDETFAEVVQDEVDNGYGNLVSADCRPRNEEADSKCMSDVWCTHDQVNLGKPRGKSRCRERLGVKRYDNKRDKAEIGRSFQLAVGAHEWKAAENLIPMADVQRLNDGLCIALDSVWFLCTHEELLGATRLIEKLVEAGAMDFTRAALRTSFLASCVSACRSRTMSLADTVTVMAQRLRERLQECSGDEMLKAEAAAKVQRFTEWALKCIGSHSRARRKGSGIEDMVTYNSSVESQLQLRAFKRFLELAGDRLSGKDYTEAFDAACFPLTLFSTAIDSGWASGIAASAMQGLLGMLVEGGADNVNQCFLEAARFGSTELVRILMQGHLLEGKPSSQQSWDPKECLWPQDLGQSTEFPLLATVLWVLCSNWRIHFTERNKVSSRRVYGHVFVLVYLTLSFRDLGSIYGRHGVMCVMQIEGFAVGTWAAHSGHDSRC